MMLIFGEEKNHQQHTHTHTHTSQVTKSLRQVKVSTHLHFKSHDGIFMFEEALEDE